MSNLKRQTQTSCILYFYLASFSRCCLHLQCSKSCGMGTSRRLVACINQETQQPDEDGYCERDHKQFKPDKNKPCHGPPCRPKSCLELKQYHSDQAFEDGHYMLQVGTDMALVCSCRLCYQLVDSL